MGITIPGSSGLEITARLRELGFEQSILMLTGQETEGWELIYFKVFKSQLPVIEQALETASLMLGSDKSRGYMLEMICADFLAGANAEDGDPDALLLSLHRLFGLLPELKRKEFLAQAGELHERSC